jgi:radical SAM protein with 4Fe4S-binding SPASM domain
MNANLPKELKTRTVTITLTQSCNLACTYCYEEYRQLKSMDFDTAYQIISSELNNKNDYEIVMIDFFGGEPFMQFDLIKRLVSAVKAEEWENDYIFFTGTNGTLVHGDVQEWLIENKDCFVCGLSFDGTKEMQNINRSNSADMIDLDFFLKHYGNEEIKMTVSPETLPMLAEGVIFLHNMGFEVSCNLAYGIDWSKESATEALERELNKLIDYYIENPNITPCSMLGMGIETIAYGAEKLLRYCGCGIDMVAYDVDGKPYPCHLFMPLSAGAEKAEKANELYFYEEEIPLEHIDDKCKDCIVKSICPTCYGSNYITFGDIYKHEDSYCKLTKIIMKARSYFKGKQWETGQLKLSKDDEQMLLKSIIMIQENL